MESNFRRSDGPTPKPPKKKRLPIQPRLDTTPAAVDNAAMIEIIPSDACQRWLARLRDRNALARIQARLLRIHYGPGCRIYCLRPNDATVVLLCGGLRHCGAGFRNVPRRNATLNRRHFSRPMGFPIWPSAHAVPNARRR